MPATPVEAITPIWSLRPTSAAAAERLQRELGLGPVVSRVLAARGYEDPESAAKFLKPDLDQLGDPRLLPDYADAADILLGAIERRERIFIHGDYDVDGMTSAALLTRFFRSLKADVVAHVPHRMREGYGIHMSAIEAAREAGAKVFLTSDCGTGAFAQIEAAREAGMRVVVTDHHELHDRAPAAHAFVNLHRTDHAYPFDGLSGVGLVFRLCEGLALDLGVPVANYRRAFLDLAALGTVVDVMELVGENRVIVRHGLPLLRSSKKAGIQALIQVSECAGLDELRTYHLGFRLGPRLNATGRVHEAALGLDLLLTEDSAEAAKIAAQLDALNKERRETERQILEQAVASIEETDWQSKAILMLVGEGWHKGVVGIVAGRLVERFGRPALVGNLDPETRRVSGSARSIKAFNLKEAIDAMHPDLGGGGHAAAAGFHLDADKLDDVRARLEEFAGERLSPEDFAPMVELDAEAGLHELDESTVAEIEALEPFGTGNPTPLLLLRGARLEGLTRMGADQSHARFKVAMGGVEVTGKAFGLADELAAIDPNELVDLAIVPTVNVWRDRRNFEIQVKHVRRVE